MLNYMNKLKQEHLEFGRTMEEKAQPELEKIFTKEEKLILEIIQH